DVASRPVDHPLSVSQLLREDRQEPRSATEMAAAQAGVGVRAWPGLDGQVALSIGERLRLHAALEHQRILRYGRACFGHDRSGDVDLLGAVLLNSELECAVHDVGVNAGHFWTLMAEEPLDDVLR